MEQTKKISYLKKHLKKISHNIYDSTKDVAYMLFDTKGYNDKFLKENGEPTMDEYSEIMRQHDLKEEKARGYYFGNVDHER